MIKIVIISLLVLQTSASFFEAFAPVENSFGRLVTDVVSDIKETIDCTILAVENVFSLGGLFGSPTAYDERCRTQSFQTAEHNPYTYDVVQTTYATPAQRQPKELSLHVDQSISEASAQIKTIIEKSNASEKIENVKNTLKSETDRLAQISAIMSRELSKLPDEVRKKFNLKHDDHPSIETLIEEVKMLYRIEQEDKSSAQANEVRRSFDEILNVLHVNNTGSTFSDAEEVKEILRNLGKISNDSFIDVEKQVEEWTEEQNKQLDDIKLVVLNTESKTQNDKSNAETEKLINKKLDEIEKEQEKMIDFSNTLKDMAKNILEKVSATTVAPKDITSVDDNNFVKNSTEKLLVSSTQPTIITTDLKGILNSTAQLAIPTTEITSTNSPLTITTTPITTSMKSILSTLETATTTTSLPPTTAESTIPTTTLAPESTTTTTITNLPPTTTESVIHTTALHESTTTSTTTTNLPPTTTESSIPTTALVPESTTTITSLPTITTESLIPTTILPPKIPTEPPVQSSTQNVYTTTPIIDTTTQKVAQTTSSFTEPISKPIETSTEAYSVIQTAQSPQTYSSITTSLPETLTSTIPSASTDFPKTFKDVAKQIMKGSSTTTTSTTEAAIDLESFFKDYHYDDSEQAKHDVIDQLFAPLDKKAQKEAVQGAKNLIQQSQLSNKLLNDFFHNENSATAPSIFDDPELLDFFS